jgi:hypothetical protein
MEGRGSEVQRTVIQHLISLKIRHHCTEHCILYPPLLFSTSPPNCRESDISPTQKPTHRLSLCSLFSAQIFRLRDDIEAKKKMKRRQKRMREKAEKDKEKLLKGPAETAGSAPTVSSKHVCTLQQIVDVIPLSLLSLCAERQSIYMRITLSLPLLSA